jgi:hypothetical protein
MKKILRGICMMALVALAFTSCKKNKETEGIRLSGTAQDFVVQSLDEERAYIVINGTRFSTNFEINDQIMVYNLNSDDATLTNYGIYWTDSDGHTVDWFYSSGTVINHQATETNLFAFYPAEIVNNARLWEGDNEAMFELVDHQTYRKRGSTVLIPKLTMAMAAKDEVAMNVDENHFDFKNIMGGLWLRLTSTSGRKVTSIVFEDNMFNVTGRVHLKVDEVDPDILLDLLNNYDPTDATYLASLNEYIQRSGYYVDDAHNSLKGKIITLDCGEGVQLGNTAQDFFIILRPLAMYGGFKLTFNFAEGEPIEYTYDGSASGLNLMIKPNELKRLTKNVDNL